LQQARRIRSEDRTIPKETKRSEPNRVQFGALPYRINERGRVEVLLITSRQAKRWIIPRGWPIKGLKPPKSAAREAYEEAGVRGRIGRRPLGRYLYRKRDGTARLLYEVRVFPLLVKRQLKNWRESKQRTARWFAVRAAAARVRNDDLRDLILAFHKNRIARQS
jgi:8-oxo-dGTP pyrophosphatase MutT (NUDIX family)